MRMQIIRDDYGGGREASPGVKGEKGREATLFPPKNDFYVWIILKITIN